MRRILGERQNSCANLSNKPSLNIKIKGKENMNKPNVSEKTLDGYSSSTAYYCANTNGSNNNNNAM